MRLDTKLCLSPEMAGVLNHFALGVQNVEQSYNLLYAGSGDGQALRPEDRARRQMAGEPLNRTACERS